MQLPDGSEFPDHDFEGTALKLPCGRCGMSFGAHTAKPSTAPQSTDETAIPEPTPEPEFSFIFSRPGVGIQFFTRKMDKDQLKQSVSYLRHLITKADGMADITIYMHVGSYDINVTDLMETLT